MAAWTARPRSRLIPADVQLGRLSEHEPANLARMVGVEPEVRKQLDERGERGSGLQPRQVNSDANVRAVPDCSTKSLDLKQCRPFACAVAAESQQQVPRFRSKLT